MVHVFYLRKCITFIGILEPFFFCIKKWVIDHKYLDITVLVTKIQYENFENIYQRMLSNCFTDLPKV